MCEIRIDNVGDSGRGPAGGDMGWVGPGPADIANTCHSDDNYPIEFSIAVSAVGYDPGEAYLEVVVPDVSDVSVVGDVHFNSQLITGWKKWPEARGGWTTFCAPIDPGLVVVGDYFTQVQLQQRTCLSVYEGFIWMAGYYEFVPEPGTVLLLGSGLVGTAGYPTLRWKSRE